MVIIALTKGYVTWVDDEDYKYLVEWKWHVDMFGGVPYAARTAYEPNKKTIYMARWLVDAPKGKEVDHRNGQSLDNRRGNLRICTTTQNHYNYQTPRGSVPYKGVTYDKDRDSFMVHGQRDGKPIHLGRYETAVEAALIYNVFARDNYGEFANLNMVTVG